MFNKKGFVEVWNSLNGIDAAELEDIIRGFDVRYEDTSTGYTYYRLRITGREVRALTKKLEKEGYNAILMDNKYFHVYDRNEVIN